MVLDLIENNAVKWAMLKLCGNYLNINIYVYVNYGPLVAHCLDT